MAISWVEDADSRQNLGPSGIEQEDVASFGLSDYATGGYAVAANAFGLARIRSLVPCGFTGTTEGYTWLYDTATGKLKAYNGTNEVGANTNFSGGTVRCRAKGY